MKNLIKKILKEEFEFDNNIQVTEEIELIEEGYKEVVLTLGLLLGGNMALSQEKAKDLLNNPKPDTIQTIDTILKNKPLLNKYVKDINNFGVLKQPKLTFVDDWVKYDNIQVKFKPPVLTGGVWLVGVKLPIN